MDVSIIIVSYNTKKLLENCINSIIKNIDNIDYEIIIVDNNSTDGSRKYLKYLSEKKKYIKAIFNKKNEGFGRANNRGFKESIGRYVLLLNSDTLVLDDGLSEMVTWMDKNKNVGVLSCALLDKDKSIQGTGGYFPSLLRAFLWMSFLEDIPFLVNLVKTFHPVHSILPFLKGTRYYYSYRELDWVTGAFMLMPRNVYKDADGFDEDYFMYTEETDLCYRIKKMGWKVVYNPKWKIIHFGGGSGTSWSYVIPEFKGVKIFYKKHYPKWHFPLLRLILKGGSFIRIFLFLIIKGKEASKTYARAFIEA